MKKVSEVMALLESHRNERGLKHWQRMTEEERGGLESFGIGLTQLRKLAKQVGRDHRLAGELWETRHHDAKVLGLLIDEPKQLTRDQVEKQVLEVGPGYLSHVFSSCDATLAKAPLAFEVVGDWIDSPRPLTRQCGWGLVYELSKNRRDKRLTESAFDQWVERIRKDLEQEEDGVRLAMAGALIGIGKRSPELNRKCLLLARKWGPIDYGGGSCEPLDVEKHLEGHRQRRKWD